MLEELFAISKYPYLDKTQGFFNKLLIVVKTYGRLYLAIIVSAPLFLLADKLVVNVFHHSSLVHQNKEAFSHIFQRLGFIKAFLFICVVGPAFEETIYRLLLSFKKQHIAISLLIAFFYFGAVFLHIKDRILRIEIELAIAVVIIGASLLFVPKTTVDVSPENKKRWIVLSICLFGLMHVFNYLPFYYPIIWIYPVFVIPQLLMGWAMTYIRFKNGFFWGVLLHCIINTVSVLFSYR